MHINIIPNRGSSPTVLLRESYREGSKVCKRTLANLSALSAAQVQMIRSTLRGDVLQPIEQAFEITSSGAHGHVQAVCLAMQRLGFAGLLASKPCRERDLVAAMVASRIICPATKLATSVPWVRKESAIKRDPHLAPRSSGLKSGERFLRKFCDAETMSYPGSN